MNKTSYYLSFCLLAVGSMAFTACNDEWKDEQYANYVSLKAPLNTSGTSVGVTTVYVPWTRVDETGNPLYGKEGMSHYDLPVIVAGTCANPNNLKVNIAHSDTLDILNEERFGHRTEIYYKDMWNFAEVPSTVDIAAGESTGLLNIKLDFNKNGGIDLADRYVLPLTVAPGAGYEKNPRKHYATAMLRILPYNSFSGVFQATNLLYSITNEAGKEEGSPAGMVTVQTYTCGQNKVFFYAGTNNEQSLLRKNFRIYAEFTRQPGFEPSTEVADRGTVRLYVDESENSEMNFRQVGVANYKILVAEDPVMTYVVRHTLIVQDIEYYYTDTKAAPGSPVNYKIKGTMTMERRLNTQMAEEDQIMWD